MFKIISHQIVITKDQTRITINVLNQDFIMKPKLPAKIMSSQKMGFALAVS